jgi:signal transduction histidine kinase
MQLIIENRKLDDPEKATQLKPFEDLLKEASNQIRLLSRSLSQEYLSSMTFQDAILKEIERLTEYAPMHVSYVPGTRKYGTLDKDQLLMSYRIFQEIINNVIRHSGATEITVRSNFNDYILKIEDNGKGFNPEEVFASGKASGLKNIRKRALLAGLDLLIKSSHDQGTVITLSIPKN